MDSEKYLNIRSKLKRTLSQQGVTTCSSYLEKGKSVGEIVLLPEADRANLIWETTLNITTSLTITERSYLSISYISTANFLANKAKELETKNRCEGGINKTEYDAFVLSSIMLPITFLEACINEIFLDYFERPSESVLKDITSGKAISKKRFNRARTFQKYNLALKALV